MTTTAQHATPAHDHDGPEPTSPSSRALRFLALGGFLALFVSLVLTGIVVLDDAISGDGVGGPAAAAGFWAVGIGAAVGLAAAALPRAVLPYQPRKYAVTLEYVLAVAAPVLALMD